jgi:heme-degrading monooxygenase HmoA
LTAAKTDPVAVVRRFAYASQHMYMRITMGRTKSGSWPSFESAYRHHIEGKAAPGLRARWLVRSTTDEDTFFTISLWNTLDEMESYERSDAVRRQVLKHMAPHLSGISTAHHCEVCGDLPLSAEKLATMFESIVPRLIDTGSPQ